MNDVLRLVPLIPVIEGSPRPEFTRGYQKDSERLHIAPGVFEDNLGVELYVSHSSGPKRIKYYEKELITPSSLAYFHGLSHSGIFGVTDEYNMIGENENPGGITGSAEELTLTSFMVFCKETTADTKHDLPVLNGGLGIAKNKVFSYCENDASQIKVVSFFTTEGGKLIFHAPNADTAEALERQRFTWQIEQQNQCETNTVSNSTSNSTPDTQGNQGLTGRQLRRTQLRAALEAKRKNVNGY